MTLGAAPGGGSLECLVSAGGTTVGRTSIGWHKRRAALASVAVLCAVAIGASAARAAAPLTWTWTPPAQSGSSGHSLIALTCQSASLCVAVNRGGNVVSSVAPVRSSWSDHSSIQPFSRLAAVSCPSAALCLAVDDAGNVYFGTPAKTVSAWTSENIDMATPLSGISCPSVSLCVAVDRAGNVLVSTSPGDPMTWSIPMPVDGSHQLTAVSCPTVSLCAAVDDAGNVLVSTSPTSMPSWQATSLTNTGALTAVSCSRSALCVAVARDGGVYATADVVEAPVTWSATPVDPLGSPAAVSCSDVGLCVVLDHAGAAFESDDPTASRPTWASAVIDPGPEGLTGVSCVSAGFCVAADHAGDTLAATLPPPAVTTGRGIARSQTVAQLRASVNPNDALLSDCHFDYGASTAYGARVPCAVVPAATGGSQIAVAWIGGLSAATTYHFRIAASSGVASADGADAVFTTPAPLKASPSLSGTAAVGNTLTCKPNLTTTAAVTLSYAWLRDSAPIAGATAASYLVAPTDQTHYLSCQRDRLGRRRQRRGDERLRGYPVADDRRELRRHANQRGHLDQRPRHMLAPGSRQLHDQAAAERQSDRPPQTQDGDRWIPDDQAPRRETAHSLGIAQRHRSTPAEGAPPARGDARGERDDPWNPERETANQAVRVWQPSQAACDEATTAASIAEHAVKLPAGPSADADAVGAGLRRVRQPGPRR